MNKKSSIGAWITIDNYEYAEIMLQHNFNWVCVDLEHSTIDLGSLKRLVSLSEKYNKTCYVRIAEINRAYINKILDTNVSGLIVANINHQEQLDKCFEYAFYSPIGKRGMGLSRAHKYGNNFKKYVQKESTQIEIIPMIESVEAINNLKSILTYPGIKKSMIGPYDLSSSINQAGNFKSKKFKSLIEKYNSVSESLNKIKGIHVVEPSIKDLDQKINENYQFIAFSTDAIIFDRTLSNITKEL